MSSITLLDGEWDFLFDTDNQGLENRWYATYPDATEKVQVPHIWEKDFPKPASAVAYYFKRFHVEAGENAKRIFLKFERVSTFATVWLNGKLLGEHFGAYTPFEYDTSKAIKLGEENILCVRIGSVDTVGRFDFGKANNDENERLGASAELPVGLPWQLYPFSGIYGSVKLILGSRAFISRMAVSTDQDQERATLELQFNNPRNFQARLKIWIANPQGEVAEMTKELRLEKENASAKIPLGFKDIEIWSPEKPNLYTVEVKLEKSFPIIRRFGFRKFDCVKGDFYLNDRILKLIGIRYSMHNADGGFWNQDPATMRADFEQIKSLGFNLVRSGGAPLSEVALDLCDELGLLVLQELPIHTQRSSPRGLEKVRELIADLVMEGISHPCIGAWALGAENGTLMLENGTKLLKALDQYDQTRPVISNLNCVYLDNEQNFKKDTGKIMGVTSDRVALFASHRLHLRMNPSRELCLFLSRYCDKEFPEIEVPDITLGDSTFQDDYEQFVRESQGKILVTLRNHSLLSELAGTARKLNVGRTQKQARALNTLHKQLQQFVTDGHGKGIWKNLESFAQDANAIAIKSKLDQITALQSNQQVSGFILDQWSDCGVDLSGLTTEYRQLKPESQAFCKITQATRLLLTGLEHTIVTKQEILFQLCLLNGARLQAIDIHVKVLDSNGKTLSTSKHKATGHTSHTPLGEYRCIAPAKPGDYFLEVELLQEGSVISTCREQLHVITPVSLKAAQDNTCFLDEAESSADALRVLGGQHDHIFTTSIASWNDTILAKIAEVTKAGKTLILSDMNLDDVESFNACKPFEHKLTAHFSTGASGASYHFLPKNSPLRTLLGDRNLLDSSCSAIMPHISLSELEGAQVLARSIIIQDGEVVHGVDLQMIPFGKGKIIFSQFNLLDNLENNPLADGIFMMLGSL